MQEVEVEKHEIENNVNDACMIIQRYVRMKLKKKY